MAKSFNINTNISVLDACIHHKEKKAELYCTQCNEAVCGKCFAIKHRDHAFLDLESETTRNEATEQTISISKQLAAYKQRLQSVEDALAVKRTDLKSSTKIAYEKIDARVDKICHNAKQFGKQLRTVITGISETQDAKLDKLSVQLQQLRSDVESGLKLSKRNTSKVSVMQAVNTLKSSKDIIKKQAAVDLPEIPEIGFPVFNEGCTNSLSVQQIGQCQIDQETNFHTTFNFENLKRNQPIYSPDTKNIEGVSCCLFARRNKAGSTLSLGMNLGILRSDTIQSCFTCYSITLHSSMDGKSITKKVEYEYNCGEGGEWQFIDWEEFVDSTNGYIDDNNIMTVSASLRINDIKRKS